MHERSQAEPDPAGDDEDQRESQGEDPYSPRRGGLNDPATPEAPEAPETDDAD